MILKWMGNVQWRSFAVMTHSLTVRLAPGLGFIKQWISSAICSTLLSTDIWVSYWVTSNVNHASWTDTWKCYQVRSIVYSYRILRTKLIPLRQVH